MSTRNKEILHQMKKIYYSNEMPYIDWMGFKITEDNCPSYHHIIKAEDMVDPTPTIANGAYLGKRSHELLHVIETNDIDLYNAWNKLFKLINLSKTYPTEDLLVIMNELHKESLSYNNIMIRRKR